MINAKISRLGPELYQCLDCNFTGRKKSMVSNHVESKHVRHGGVSCDVCGQLCATRQAYRMHKSRVHKNYKGKEY